MRTEFRRIHALNAGDTIAEVTGMRNKQWVFENIGSFSQVAEEEISAGILGTFIITETSLPFITAQYIHWFHG